MIDTIEEKKKEKTDLDLQKSDFDITHRFGVYNVDKHRPIIVKFVRLQTKIDLFKVSKKLKNHNIFVNKDLTKLNADVFASCRVKESRELKRHAHTKEKSTFSITNFSNADTIQTIPRLIEPSMAGEGGFPAQALCQPAVAPPTSHCAEPRSPDKFPGSCSGFMSTPGGSDAELQTLSQAPAQAP